MRIPERPTTTADLNLMQRLLAYADGKASWLPGNESLGRREQDACRDLHAKLLTFIDELIHPLLDRVTSREMEGFTMHDRYHGLKVAHLMWHITKPTRRELLTPPEIALLVMSAHFHDLGMGLSADERRARLTPDSDLWDRVEGHAFYIKALDALGVLAAHADTPTAIKADAALQVQQAQEALLCADCRERHATPARYSELLNSFREMHKRDAAKIPNVDTLLSFGGDSFAAKLIEICVSHNEDAYSLVERDRNNPDQWRLPTDYPVGPCIADTRYVAAALRLADVIDFDRERTPAVLFHYLLPQSDDPVHNVSLREWSKHLAISNWEITDSRLAFRGRSSSALTHHTVVKFCEVIDDEIVRTKSTFDDPDMWPFALQTPVSVQIEATGYRYVPYRFSVDEERVYDLFMGGAIYEDRLDAIRELVQNAVDACRLRDALLISYDPSVTPSKINRIIIRYEEPTAKASYPVISVIDTGVGMDRWVIETYFLKVGRSYYKSGDFLKIRSDLRRAHADFSPVSEFGIGFLSSFLLGDRVIVETAPAQVLRHDTIRRTLKIDGVGRLIEVSEHENSKNPRFHGTRVSIMCAKSEHDYAPPSFGDLEEYIHATCINLPYSLTLEHVAQTGTSLRVIEPTGLKVAVPASMAHAAIHIPVSEATGLRGEIVLYKQPLLWDARAALAAKSAIREASEGEHLLGGQYSSGTLVRGGFAIGEVPGLPISRSVYAADAQIEVGSDRTQKNILPSTDLSRSRLVDPSRVRDVVFRTWFENILKNVNEYEKELAGTQVDVEYSRELLRAKWIEKYDAFTLYRVAKMYWRSAFHGKTKQETDTMFSRWEAGDDVMPYAMFGFASNILDLFMPKVNELVLAKDGAWHLAPLNPNWLAELKGYRSYLTEALTWGAYMNYCHELKEILLFMSYTGDALFNRIFRPELSVFDEVQLFKLRQVIRRLIGAKNSETPTLLEAEEVVLFKRAKDVLGASFVQHQKTKYRVADLA